MKEKASSILKLIGKILLWIIALAFIAAPAIVINQIYGYFLILFVIVLILISLVCMLILKKKIVIESKDSRISARRGDDIDVNLKIKNTSLLFCPKLIANIFITDLFGDYNGEHQSRFMLAGHDSIDFGFGSEMNHIGVYDIGIDKIRIYDFTGFFHADIPLYKTFSACITPKIRHMEELHISEDIMAETSNNTRVTVVGGTDYTGVREYALGDPMKQIHWKLSAHAREYMTKLQESNRQQEFSVILDFASIEYEDHEILMDVNDTLIETALSLISDISGHDAGYKLLYCDRNHSVSRITPVGRSNDLEMISNFIPINPDPDGEFPDASEILKQEETGQNRASNVLIVTSRPTKDLIQELERIKNQRRGPELYLVVPSSWSDRQVEELAAPLRQLEDSSIPYFIIETDINRTGNFKKEGEEE